jgi:DeoR/GlpR family transcriptional regulator of sugar metabolism
LAREGKVRVTELSRQFGISEVTVRNDLTELEAEGLLERVHGGAVLTQKAYFNMTLGDRMKVNEAEKRAIATYASSMIKDGSTLIVISGTTPLFALKELRNVKNLTVITNSIPVAHEAGFCSNMHVIILGGSFDSNYQITYGDDTVNQLRKYKADMLLLSADGFSAEDGVTTHLYFDAEINRQMIARANRTIALAD